MPSHETLIFKHLERVADKSNALFYHFLMWRLITCQYLFTGKLFS